MRILDFDPQHDLPITEDMIASPQQRQNPSSSEIKRQLALKEQDLVYAKQRAEKVQKENENLRIENDKLLGQISRMREMEEKKGENDMEEKIRKLEEEKNALLDYIEESVNVS